MTPATPSWTRLAAALALAAAWHGAARAEASPYYAGISVGGGHLSNITLVPSNSGQVRSDLYTSLGLVAGIDQPFGRQRFFANGTVTANKFQDETRYDNTGYNLAAGLDWSSAERLSGNVNLGLQQRLEYSTGTAAQTAEKNVARTGQLSARVQYGLAELMALEGSVSHREARYTAAAYANSRLTQDSASAGIRHRLGGQLDLGAALRLSHGRFPAYAFDRRDLDLTANWVLTGASTVNGRVSVGRQDNAGNVADYSVVSGRLQWAYTPTGKLRFLTTLRRDSGADNGLEPVRTTGPAELLPSEFTRLTNGLSVAVTYEATAKIRFNASAGVARRSLRQVTTLADGTPGSGIEGSDTTTELSLGATYAPTRHWQFTCDLSRQSRTTDANPLLTYAYGNTAASCSAQYVIQ